MKKNESGFSLIEILIATGLFGGLGYLIMQQASMGAKQKIWADFNHLVNSTTSAIQADVSKSKNCTASFKGLRFGSDNSPGSVSAIYLGKEDPSTTPPTVSRAEIEPLFEVRKDNSMGIYIDSMGLVKRATDGKEVLRVIFKAGDIVGGRVRERTSNGKKDTAIRDFVISTEKEASGEIGNCYGELNNTLSTACTTLPEGQWDPVNKKCELKGLIKKDDLIQLWTTSTGGLSPTKPASVSVKTVSCHCHDVRCSSSKAKNCWCTVPACPPNSVAQNHTRVTKMQSAILNKKCVLEAQCMYQSQPTGWMVKP